MDAAATTADLLSALAPSWSAAVVLASYLAYLAAAAALLPGKLVAVLPDSSRLHYRCNGLLPLPLLLGLSALGVYMGWMTPTVRSTVGFLASALPPHHRPVRHVEARREGQAAQAGQGRREGLPRAQGEKKKKQREDEGIDRSNSFLSLRFASASTWQKRGWQWRLASTLSHRRLDAWPAGSGLEAPRQSTDPVVQSAPPSSLPASATASCLLGLWQHGKFASMKDWLYVFLLAEMNNERCF
ncbi:hypothetical protein VPH35_112763 [Triticum aestivum]|uniref:uncharacterized protein isoform X2 n=1 Tax=Triticum aestivum TaxID=4565 RepID=UPI001D01A466|nr:uncharacterized protein LOC123138565 isoform X2 [Triticum aestivum]